MQVIGAGCPSLRSINLAGCAQVTDLGGRAIGTGVPSLTSLDLTECGQVTDAGVQAICAGCPSLTSIILMNCSQVTDAGVQAIGAGCPSLRVSNQIKSNRVLTSSLCGSLVSSPVEGTRDAGSLILMGPRYIRETYHVGLGTVLCHQ